MRIAFNKILKYPSDFNYQEGDLKISGQLQRVDSYKAELIGEIEGEIELVCNRCGKSFKESINIPLKLYLSNRAIKIDDELEDMMEFLDGIIDISQILESEIASYLSDYHYCPKCAESEEEIDIEF